jgi:hypothetical protein
LKLIKQTQGDLSLTDDSLTDPEEDYKYLAGVLAVEPTSEIVQLYSQGIREMREGRPELALETLSRAWKMAPDDAVLQKAVASAVLDNAARLIDEGNHQAGLDLVEQWIPRLTTQERLPHQVEFLRQWPRLRLFLKETEILHTVRDYQEVLLPFESSNVDTLWVHLEVEDDNLCLTASLPPFSNTQEETVLGNLLLASREMMLFKVAASAGTDLTLKGLVPFRLLNAVRFLLTSFGISKYADVPPDKLARRDELCAWFREKRAAFAADITSRDHLSATSRAVEALCQDPKLKGQRLSEVHYLVEAPFGQVEMEAWPEGVRLSTRLGSLQKKGRLKTLRQLVELNTSLKLGKLALAEDEGVLLSVELPYLDTPTAGDAFDFLAKYVSELQPELTEMA